MEKVVGELPKTILFEYSNTQELVEYLIKNHVNKLQEWVAPQKNEGTAQESPVVQPVADPVSSFSINMSRFLKPEEMIWTTQEQRIHVQESNRGEEQEQRVYAQEANVFHHQEHSIHDQKGSAPDQQTDDIAIIGISGRYPLSNTLEELWEHLKAGHNCITEVASDRWQGSLSHRLFKGSSRKPDKKYYGGFLESIDRFDYQLFEVSRQQVMELSPEIRLFLEIVWETFENAGYGKFRLNELQRKNQTGVGVFVGNMYNQYCWSIPSFEQAILSSNGTDWHIANRISHFFNLTGPSLAISSACSSSLSAIHLACESLKQQSCSMAIAGGINLALDPSKYDVLERAHLLGSGNACKSFGISDGFIPGEGVGSVLLKPLSRAIQDHDHIYAVIKSSMVNHSGGRQMYAAPDPKLQAQLITNSIWRSGIDPTTIGYIESAANGSELGDSIEVIALQQAFAHYTEKKHICALGSVKSNLGHLEAASGISQLSKVLLQMEHATLVPSINAKPINPTIKLERTAFYLQEEVGHWERPIDPRTGKSLPRRSMINSFGAGGSYANLIIEEYVGDASGRQGDPESQQEFLLIFSAKTKWSLIKYLEKMSIFLRQGTSMGIGDIARNLQKIDHGLEHRVAIQASSVAELLDKLGRFQHAPISSEECTMYTSFDHNTRQVEIVDALTILQLLDKKDLRQIARHWVTGAKIDFTPFYKDKESAWVDLPHYVFDHQEAFRFVDNEDAHVEDSHDEYRIGETSSVVADLQLKQSREVEIYQYNEPYLKGHQMNGEQVLIGATHASLAIKAFEKRFPEQTNVCIRKLNYIEPIEVKENQNVEVKVDISQKGAGIDFQVIYRHSSAEGWKPTAAGKYEQACIESKYIDVQRIKGTLEEFQDVGRIYERGRGLVKWGDIFKIITQVYMGHEQILARIVLNLDPQDHRHEYELNPLITNAAYLAMLYVLEQANIEGGFLPFGIHEIQFEKNKGFTQGWLLIKLVKMSDEVVIFDVDAINDVSEVAVRYTGYALKRIYSTSERKRQGASSTHAQSQYETQKTMLSTYEHVASSRSDIASKITNYLINKLSSIVPEGTWLSDTETSFLELGLDSSRLVVMAQEIEEETDIELSPTVFFEYPNIQELTEFFASEHKREFAQVLENVAELSVSRADPMCKPVEMAVPDSASATNPREQINEGIAIIGMSGQFLEAENLIEYWNNLADGKDRVSEIPRDRGDWLEQGGEREKEADQVSIQWGGGGLLEGMSECDPLFFGLSPQEATLMDPQLYLLLAHTWKAMEDAGITRQALEQSPTGVFVAAAQDHYVYTSADSQNRPQQPAMIPSLIPSGVSYALNLQGPSEYCEAACVSSFVALHRAVQSLHTHECEQAIVGGVNLHLSPLDPLSFEARKSLRKEGQDRSCQEEANGCVRSEGVGVILIKPLQKAIEDGDPIHAVIRGIGVHHGGRGLSPNTPNPSGMKEAMLKAYRASHIDPRTVSYIEAHCIASPMVDTLELEALKSGYIQLVSMHPESPQQDTPCSISSLSPDIRHGEQVSGMAALFKVILAMQQKTIPGNPGIQSLKKQVSLEGSPFQIMPENQQWKELKDHAGNAMPRRASINSYGLNGMNAHVVLEEYRRPQEEKGKASSVYAPQILVFSAKNQDRLNAIVRQTLAYVKLHNELSLPNVAYTLQVGREAMDFRLALIVSGQVELIQGLEEYLEAVRESRALKPSPPIFLGEIEEDHIGMRKLLEGKPGEVVFQTLVSENDVEKIALYWVKGGNVPWELLHRSERVRRISLPTYSFFEKRTSCRRDSKETLEKQQQPEGSQASLSEGSPGPLTDHQQHHADAPTISGQQTRDSIVELRKEFPELIHLNRRYQGRPVFWLHGGQGGVEIYQMIAHKSQRPFYGIQAPGYVRSDTSIKGIEKMAAYYIEIIRSVQPEGPYDVGGYSLGGILAYEITRQMQQSRQKVDTIVMIDSPYGPKFTEKMPSLKSFILQIVNTLLIAIAKESDERSQILISHEEVDISLDDEEFVKQMIDLAKARGLTRTNAYIRNAIQQHVKIQRSYELQDYTVLPLPDASAVEGYYLRNKSGVFLGSLEPYLTIPQDKLSLDRTVYWEEWTRQISRLHISDVDSSNHMSMLSEQKASGAIAEFCEKLYTEENRVATLL